MIVNRNISRVLLSVVIFTMIIFSMGCNGRRNNDYDKKSMEKNTRKPPIETEKIKKEESDILVSSGYCMALGVLEKNVAINGPERNESEVSILDGHILFPQGAIRSLCIGSWSRKDSSYNIKEAEIDSLIDEIENAKILEKLPEKKIDNISRIRTKVLLLNSHGEFRTVNITSYGKGYHEMFVEKDDEENFSSPVDICSDSGKKKEHLFFKSKEIENAIKKWIMFEKNDNVFEKLNKVNLSVDESDASVQIQDEELEVLVNCIKNKKKTNDNPCGHDYYFECCLQDGSMFHFSLCSDGESLSTDRHVYSIDNSDSKKIYNQLKSINKRMTMR